MVDLYCSIFYNSARWLPAARAAAAGSAARQPIVAMVLRARFVMYFLSTGFTYINYMVRLTHVHASRTSMSARTHHVTCNPLPLKC